MYKYTVYIVYAGHTVYYAMLFLLLDTKGVFINFVGIFCKRKKEKVYKYTVSETSIVEGKKLRNIKA